MPAAHAFTTPAAHASAAERRSLLILRALEGGASAHEALQIAEKVERFTATGSSVLLLEDHRNSGPEDDGRADRPGKPSRPEVRPARGVKAPVIVAKGGISAPAPPRRERVAAEKGSAAEARAAGIKTRKRGGKIDDAELTALWVERVPTTSIAKHHNVSVSAVHFRAGELKLPKRDMPVGRAASKAAIPTAAEIDAFIAKHGVQRAVSLGDPAFTACVLWLRAHGHDVQKPRGSHWQYGRFKSEAAIMRWARDAGWPGPQAAPSDPPLKVAA